MYARSPLALAVAAMALVADVNVASAQSITRSWNNPPQAPVAGVEHHTFPSAALSTDVGYNILLPPNYESTSRRYPVIYQLHGAGGDENNSVEDVAPRVIEAFEAGTLPPLIVVFVNGPRWSFYADSPDGRVPSETVFIRELIPHIDSTYRTIVGREGRAIQGMSMGGAGALAHALKHSNLFGSIVAYAPALLEPQPAPDGRLTLLRRGGTHEGAPPPSPQLSASSQQAFYDMFGGRPDLYAQYDPFVLLPLRAERLAQSLPIRIVIGTADGLWNANQLFHQLLLDHGYSHDFVVVPDVGHSLSGLLEVDGIEGIRFQVESNGWR